MLRTMLYILILMVCTNCSKSGGVDASTTIANQVIKKVIFDDRKRKDDKIGESN